MGLNLMSGLCSVSCWPHGDSILILQQLTGAVLLMGRCSTTFFCRGSFRSLIFHYFNYHFNFFFFNNSPFSQVMQADAVVLLDVGNMYVPPTWIRPGAAIIYCKPALEKGIALYVVFPINLCYNEHEMILKPSIAETLFKVIV